MNAYVNDDPRDEPVETALAVLSAGWASLEQIADAVAARRTQRPLIGQLMLTHRMMTVHQVFAVLAEEATSHMLFGQLANEMGFVSAENVDKVLFHQTTMCPPLRQVLLSRGVVTPAQAESIQATTRDRMQQASDTHLVESIA
jgi:hypothetical protein